VVEQGWSAPAYTRGGLLEIGGGSWAKWDSGTTHAQGHNWARLARDVFDDGRHPPAPEDDMPQPNPRTARQLAAAHEALAYALTELGHALKERPAIRLAEADQINRLRSRVSKLIAGLSPRFVKATGRADAPEADPTTPDRWEQWLDAERLP